MGERTAVFPGVGWTGPAYLAGILIGLDHPVGRGPAVPLLVLGFLAVAGLVGFVARAARRAALGGREPPPAEVQKVFGGILFFLLSSGYLAASRGLGLLLLTGSAMMGALLCTLPPLALSSRRGPVTGIVPGLLLLLTVLTPVYLLDGTVWPAAWTVGSVIALGFLLFGREDPAGPWY